MNIVFNSLKVISIVIFLYMLWKHTKDNLNEETVPFNWFVLMSFLVGGRVVWSIFNLTKWNNNIFDWFIFWDNPGFSFVAGLVSILGFVFVYCLYNRFHWVELGEDILIPVLVFGCMWLLAGWPKFFGGDYWLAIGLVLVGITTIWAKRYRSFYCYKSGKKGFLLLFSAGLYSLWLFGVDIYTKNGSILSYLALGFGLLFWSSLVILGELIKLDFFKK